MNLNSLIEQYKGKWVAFRPNSNVVITSGIDAKKVYAKAKKEIATPTLFKVPVKYTPNIG